MSQHRKTGRTARVSARQYVTTGVGGAAVVGVGVLLAAPPGAVVPSTVSDATTAPTLPTALA
jgi:hypothetical protein